jgi:hypothetical protein
MNVTYNCTAALGEQQCLDMPNCTGFSLAQADPVRTDLVQCFFRSNPPLTLINDIKPCGDPTRLMPRADEGLYVRIQWNGA